VQVSLNWLKSYLDLPYPPERIGEMLTALGLEVEGQEDWVSIQGKLEGIVVGKVLTCGKHPGADRLSLTTVDVGGEEPVQIVCGAPSFIPDGSSVSFRIEGFDATRNCHEDWGYARA
jgi:phenylalanyl-tRNA synthetase beta chain